LPWARINSSLPIKLQHERPIVCGTTNYNVPAQFNPDWVDLSGAIHAAANSVMIGSNPILLDGQ